MNNLRIHSLFLAAVVPWLWAAEPASCATLPAEVPINPEAGRGGLLIVPVRLESGEEVPFIVDSGSGSCLDKSLESKLDKPVGTDTVQSWGVETKVNVYVTPKLYLGGAALETSPHIVTYDLARLTGSLDRGVKGILGIDCLHHYCI